MTEPNIVDVIKAVPEEAHDLLGMIFAAQEADRNHWASIQDSWLAQALATKKAMSDGIEWALNNCEYGGTTAQYESTLRTIEWVVRRASHGELYNWYVEKFTEDQFFKGVHIAYGGSDYGTGSL